MITDEPVAINGRVGQALLLTPESRRELRELLNGAKLAQRRSKLFPQGKHAPSIRLKPDDVAARRLSYILADGGALQER